MRTKLLFYDEKEEGKSVEFNRILRSQRDFPKSLCRRWWVCKDWQMPCGGTHPRNTKEIGKIKLKRKNIGAGKERIEILLA